MSKTIYTLCVNKYAPAIRELTYPFLKHHAAKIGAEFVEITERKYPEWPITFEKFQVGEIARKRGDDWSIFFDADTLINPEQFDITNYLPWDTVAHNGNDFAGARWKYNDYFRRDGRHLSSCTWCVIASRWCLDLWDKPEDSLEEILSNIYITVNEHNSGECKREHLIDDYLLSRNIARFGLKFTRVTDIGGQLGLRAQNGEGVSPYLWHKYAMPESQKVREMVALLSTPQKQLAFVEQGEIVNTPGGPRVKTADGRMVEPCGVGWGLMSQADAADYRKRWGIR